MTAQRTADRDSTKQKRMVGIVVTLVAVVLVLNLFEIASSTLGGDEPSGPPSSSYTTTPDGLAAYASLLERNGHPVDRLRVPVEEAFLDPTGTLVLLDPPKLSAEATDNIRSFLEVGGRLVAGGRNADAWLTDVLPSAPIWAPEVARSARPILPAPEISAVQEVSVAGFGLWTHTGEAAPLLGAERGILLAVAQLGAGRAVLLAQASPLTNELLAEPDNAALGLSFVGEGPVTFVESVHGFGLSQGLSAIPIRWRWAFAGLGLAALIWMASKARRLGPPSSPTRPLPPPRRAYVDAVAATLARTRRPDDAAAPVRRAVRARIARRGGLEGDVGTPEIIEAAKKLGLPPDEIDAVVRPGGEESIVAAGRALARLEARHGPAERIEGGTG